MFEELNMYKEKMQKTIHALENDYNTIRAGRANPHILDKIKVDYYGQPSPLQQVGNVTVPEPRLIQIQPWDSNILKDIEKAILASDIGINPSNDGKIIRLVFPELTEERRTLLSKEVKKKGEESKVAIRNIRRDAMEHFKKAEKSHDITEDDLKDYENKVQKLTDKFIKEVDVHVGVKTEDILTV